MATVYEAYQESLDRVVAVKVLADTGDPQFVTRFQREAQLIAKLEHRNIVPIHDCGDQDGVAYLVLQYVQDGRTLADLAGTPLALARAVGLLTGVLAGLGHAHDQGWIHRDVKPSNVLLPDPDWPLLADFGIAKLMQEDAAALTATGRQLAQSRIWLPSKRSD
jgi:serine/threonine-protein kinase